MRMEIWLYMKLLKWHEQDKKKTCMLIVVIRILIVNWLNRKHIIYSPHTNHGHYKQRRIRKIMEKTQYFINLAKITWNQILINNKQEGIY